MSRTGPGRFAAPLRALTAVALCLAGCAASDAARRSGRLLDDGFDREEHGAWVVLTGPGSVLLAGGNLLVGSFLPLGPPLEPDDKWFRTYDGPMLPLDEVAVLCHRNAATRVDRLRRPGGAWIAARHRAWHYPRCLEVLPGRYELEVGYFRRATDRGDEQLVTLQAESTEPSRVEWSAEPGALYELWAAVGPSVPASGPAPRRHVPRSRALGTTWWDLETSAWQARIGRVASWDEADPGHGAARRAWEEYERARR